MEIFAKKQDGAVAARWWFWCFLQGGGVLVFVLMIVQCAEVAPMKFGTPVYADSVRIYLIRVVIPVVADIPLNNL